MPPRRDWLFRSKKKIMYKLLNDKTRKEVQSEYSMRRTAVILSGLLIIFVVGIICLLPSYLLSNSRFNEVMQRSEINDFTKAIREEDDPRLWLNETNQKLALFNPALDKDRPSLAIEKLLAERQSGITVGNFVWRKVGENVVLTVWGRARDRQAVITLGNRVNDSGAFSKVVFPISNLAKDKDIDFQINLTPAPSQQN